MGARALCNSLEKKNGVIRLAGDPRMRTLARACERLHALARACVRLRTYARARAYSRREYPEGDSRRELPEGVPEGRPKRQIL